MRGVLSPHLGTVLPDGNRKEYRRNAEDAERAEDAENGTQRGNDERRRAGAVGS